MTPPCIIGMQTLGARGLRSCLLYIAQSAMSTHPIACADMVKMVAVWRDVCHYIATK